ncbi:hypothetical protein, partial [Burkholderia cepacia]|uniref:hypothetical protein n=1 Tax=Burkholderia cepacia TaxID=292 RepID=UPI001ABA5F2B
MTRALSPFAATVAHDLINENFGDNASIAREVNHRRSTAGQVELRAYGLAQSSWARRAAPADPGAYSERDIGAFRDRLVSPGTMQPALAGLAPRGVASGPEGSAQTHYAQQSNTSSTVSRLASQFQAQDLVRAAIRRINPQDFSGPPLPSGASVDSQALSVGLSQRSSNATSVRSIPSQSASSHSGVVRSSSTRHTNRSAPYPIGSSVFVRQADTTAANPLGLSRAEWTKIGGK